MRYIIPDRGYTRNIKEAAVGILLFLKAHDIVKVSEISDNILRRGIKGKALLRAKCLLRSDGFIQNVSIKGTWYVKFGDNISNLENKFWN